MKLNHEPSDWRPDVALLCGVAALTAALGAGAFLDVGIAVRDWSHAHHPGWLHAPARGLNQLRSANLLADALLRDPGRAPVPPARVPVG